tara:strand:- start:411 stop:635 length:225 start_codon:yes stop_codon:yes gene_type:complete
MEIKKINPQNKLPLGTTDKIDEIANNDSFVVQTEITWDSIEKEFQEYHRKNMVLIPPGIFKWLKKNYNVPTPKI